jgi:hypothetical protein
MDKIGEFFQAKDTLQILLPIVKSESALSLRVIDFFVTNYARKNEVIYDIINDKKRKEKFMVHYSYKAQLKAYSKKQFDPFCRRERIVFFVEQGEKEYDQIRTTVGQLNFFRWAIKNGVLDYILKNLEEIENEMNQSHRKGKRKRKKLKVKRNKDRLAENETKEDNETKESAENQDNETESVKVTVNTEDPADEENRKDLTLSATKKVSKHNVTITVKFD